MNKTDIAKAALHVAADVAVVATIGAAAVTGNVSVPAAAVATALEGASTAALVDSAKNRRG